MRKTIVIHPFLLAVFPIASLYAHNVKTALLAETFIPTAITVGFTGAMVLFCRLSFRDLQKSGAIISGFLLLFFTFGPVFSSISHWQIGNFQIGDHIPLALFIWIFIFACYVYFFARSRSNLHHLTRLFNIVAVFLLTIPLTLIGSTVFELYTARQNVKGMPDINVNLVPSKKPAKLPDIYYIVVDRYADSKTLSDIYGFDNKDFLDYLINKGFYVANGSSSNYLKTAHSLASSLNMTYINGLSKKLGQGSDNWLPLFDMMQNHAAWRFLKSEGYQFVHLGSWWGPTRQNQYADINYIFDPLPRMFYILYHNTMLFPIGFHLGLPDFRLRQWKRELYNFDTLAHLPPSMRPRFVFAHILITHEPYVFDQDGEFLTLEDTDRRSRRENYVNQVIFANKKLRVLINRLLSASETPPIIILQSDEGPFPRRYQEDELNFKWEKATEEELRQKMGILNAYYLPDVDKTFLYSTITPVNSFRLILNLYFGTSLELLPDKNYAFVDQRHPYSFFDVTDIVVENSLK